MKPPYPIVVCSKGRPKGTTFNLLRTAGLPYMVIVEPQDKDAYLETHKEAELLVMEHDNLGLSYARQVALDSMDGRYWMLDDDISSFYRTNFVTHRCEKTDIVEALTCSQYEAGNAMLDVVGLSYRQFAWSAKTPVRAWTNADGAVLINALAVKEAGGRYNPDLKLKADRFFALECAMKGLRVGSVMAYAFSANMRAGNTDTPMLAGGQTTEYNDRLAIQRSVNLMKEHFGPMVTVVDKGGRPDIKVNWKPFRDREKVAMQ